MKKTELEKLGPEEYRAVIDAAGCLDTMMKPHPEEEGEPTSDPVELAIALLHADLLKVDESEPEPLSEPVRWHEISTDGDDGTYVTNVKTGDTWIKRRSNRHSVKYAGSEDLGWYDNTGWPNAAAEPIWLEGLL